MKCEICQRNVPVDGVTLFRVNQTGQKGVWRCKAHLTAKQRVVIDPVLKRVVKMIERAK
jgi:hypothetical protein